MTPKQIRSTVNRAWLALEKVCLAHGLSAELEKMLYQSNTAERAHRAFGRGFTNGQAGYHVSADTAAKLISLQKVAEQLAERKMPTVLECGAVRDDVVTAWYIAERLKRSVRLFQERRKLKADLEPILAIDYAKDCAK